MNEPVPTPPAARRAFPLVGLMQIGLLLVYTLEMWHAHWAFDAGGFWGFGAPPDATRAAFGAPRGAPQDLAAWIVTPWLHQSLIGAVLLTLWWGGLGRTLRGLVGLARTWQLFVLGGAAAVWMHGLQHPEAPTTQGVGPIDAILAGVGAQIGWGLTHGGAQARKLVISGVLGLALLFGLLWWFAGAPLTDPAVRAAVGLEGMGAALGVGLALALVWRVVSWPRALDVVAGFLMLGALVAGAADRAPGVVAGRDRAEALAFLERLEQVEYEAWHLADKPGRATPERRADLGRRIDALLEDPWLAGREGRADLAAYAEALRAWTKPVELPWIPEAAARQAFDRWYEAHEKPLREALGLRARSAPRFYWRPR